MQFLYSLILFACPASAGNVLAQNVFEGISVEPRPSEHMHWDTEPFAEIQSDLEQLLEDSSRICPPSSIYLNRQQRATTS